MIKVEDIPNDKVIVYDIETDGLHPPYCRLEMISYQLGLGPDCEPRLVKLSDRKECDRLRQWLSDPEMIKVSYNGINFDDIILMRYGFYVEPKNRHDMYLALKTVNPGLPSHSLKFASWWYFGDWHEPQRLMERWLLRNGRKRHDMYKAPPEILGAYCTHDVKQTATLFRMLWEVIQRELHWNVYTTMELAMGDPLHEMVMFAGEWLDTKDIAAKIAGLEVERQKLLAHAIKLSKGRITNAASSLQVSKYLHDIDGLELELSKAGNYIVRKVDLIALLPTNAFAKCIFDLRDVTKVIQHYKAHLNAAMFETKRTEEMLARHKGAPMLPIDLKLSLSKSSHKWFNHSHNGHDLESVPKGYTMSSARTRRFQSSSRFGINFQNQNKRTKLVALVPSGWLGCWADSRQIENVVHIWASKDQVRRAAYEADPDWNEYVWLCNTILGTKYSRKELEAMPSPLDPNTSIYVQYKRIKLAMNFFMGHELFAKRAGLTKEQARELFDDVHRACPAIKGICNVMRPELFQTGYVKDPWGHLLDGDYKDMPPVAMYFQQGSGTSSAPKAMTVANYATLHALDSVKAKWSPCVWHPFRRKYSYGTVCGTTHDECAFRISLGLPTKTIIQLIRACLYNMEEKFSPLFDNIPLRAQLAVSITNASAQEELKHKQPDFEEKLINEYIRPGRKQAGLRIAG